MELSHNRAAAETPREITLSKWFCRLPTVVFNALEAPAFLGGHFLEQRRHGDRPSLVERLGAHAVLK